MIDLPPREVPIPLFSGIGQLDRIFDELLAARDESEARSVLGRFRT